MSLYLTAITYEYEAMGFAIDWGWALVALGVGALVALLWWRRRGGHSHLLFSDLEGLRGTPTWRVRLAWVPGACKGVALICLLCALANPRIAVEEEWEGARPPVAFDEFDEERELPTEGVALYLVLDQSGSMEKGMAFDEQRRKLPRIEVLKRVTAQFVKERSDDLIGLIGFARVAHVLCPLTLDRRALMECVGKLGTVKSSREDGTALGYALFKTVNLIAATRHFAEDLIEKGRPAYEIKGAAIVLVTDGIPNPHPLDRGHALREIEMGEAARYAAEQGVRIHIVNVEPLVMAPQYIKEREELEKAAEVTGGRFFVAGDVAALQEVYQQIDQLERSQIGQVRKGHVKEQSSLTSLHELPLYPYLVGVALTSLFIGVVLQLTWLRRVV